MKTRKQKQTDLEQLKADFNGIGNAYLIDFKGMTVSEDAQLREAVAKAKITYRVVKNTLARLAVEGTRSGIHSSARFAPCARIRTPVSVALAWRSRHTVTPTRRRRR